MVEMPDEVVAALRDTLALKVVATVNSAGVPNAAIILTVYPLDAKTICFADLRLGKTKENLFQTRKFTVTVLKQDLESYEVRCTFSSYEERSDRANLIAEMVYARARLQPRGVVFGAVEEVYSTSPSDPGARLA